MSVGWAAISEHGDWTAIPRFRENPTRRHTIEAAEEMREYCDWGWGDEFRNLVRAMEPIRVHHTTGEEARDASDGEWDDFYQETADGELLAWCVR